MASTDIINVPHRETSLHTVLAGFLTTALGPIRAYARKADDRRVIVKLARFDRRLIEDMGLDPDAIYGAVDGTWDGIHRGEFPKV